MIVEDEVPSDDTDPDVEKFFEALERGDLISAEKQLRQIKLLRGEEISRLADFLSNDKSLSKYHEYKLIFKRRLAGKPSRPKLEHKLLSLSRARHLETECKKTKSLKAALAIVGDKTGVGRTTLMNDRARLRRLRNSKSPLKTSD